MLTRNTVRAVQWAVRILTLGHVAVFLHECAHAFAALWYGEVVSSIVIGDGPLLFRFRHFGTFVEFRERGGGGHCMIHLTRGRPLRKFWIYMAGPIASWVWVLWLCFAAAETSWLMVAFFTATLMCGIGSVNDLNCAAGYLADALIESAKKRAPVNPTNAAIVNSV